MRTITVVVCVGGSGGVSNAGLDCPRVVLAGSTSAIGCYWQLCARDVRCTRSSDVMWNGFVSGRFHGSGVKDLVIRCHMQEVVGSRSIVFDDGSTCSCGSSAR
jgi:hypothetical protein